MKLAHQVTIDQAIEALRAAQAALEHLQTKFTVNDYCEKEVVLARQRLERVETTLFKVFSK